MERSHIEESSWSLVDCNMGGLHCLELRHKLPSEPLVLTPDQGDHIVMVTERYHYKKDLLGMLLGAKHSYIVTTTASGHSLKWDKVATQGLKKSLRCQEYDPAKDNNSVLYRRSVVKGKVTEDWLSDYVHEVLPADYDFADRNCQTHSRAIFNELAQTEDNQLPNGGFLKTWNTLTTALMSEEKRRDVQQRLVERYIALTNLRID